MRITKGWVTNNHSRKVDSDTKEELLALSKWHRGLTLKLTSS